MGNLPFWYLRFFDLERLDMSGVCLCGDLSCVSVFQTVFSNMFMFRSYNIRAYDPPIFNIYVTILSISACKCVNIFGNNSRNLCVFQNVYALSLWGFQHFCCKRLVLGQCMTIIRLKNPPASF